MEWNGCALRMRSETTTTMRGVIIGAWVESCTHIYIQFNNCENMLQNPFRVKLARVAKLFRFAVVIIIDAAATAVSTLNWLMMMTIKSVRFTEKKNAQHRVLSQLIRNQPIDKQSTANVHQKNTECLLESEIEISSV